MSSRFKSFIVVDPGMSGQYPVSANTFVLHEKGPRCRFTSAPTAFDSLHSFPFTFHRILISILDILMPEDRTRVCVCVCAVIT